MDSGEKRGRAIFSLKEMEIVTRGLDSLTNGIIKLILKRERNARKQSVEKQEQENKNTERQKKLEWIIIQQTEQLAELRGEPES